MADKSNKLDFYNRIAAHKAAEALRASFPFEWTSEPKEYWEEIYNRLLQIADDGKL